LSPDSFRSFACAIPSFPSCFLVKFFCASLVASFAMARNKSSTPVRRTPSETHKQSNGISHQLDGAVHSLEQKIEAQAELMARNPQEQKEAGLAQLLICVGGIYASLYGLPMQQARGNPL
jgi:hypothetical protein